jgi:hypothetical protein
MQRSASLKNAWELEYFVESINFIVYLAIRELFMQRIVIKKKLTES